MSSANTLPVVVFRIGDLTCAAPAARVREVLPRLPATRIPGVPGAVQGLVSLRAGRPTVIDAPLLLGRPAGPGAEGGILVLDLEGRRFGLTVSEVLDFAELPAASVAAREELPGVDPTLVRAVANHADRHFVLLDLDTLLAPVTGGNPEPFGGAS